MSGIGRSGPAQSGNVGPLGGAPAPKVTEYPFNAFAPNTIKPVDGGALVAEGPLNRYAHATVKGWPDGVTVIIRERSSPEQPERAATAGELKELEGALEAYVKQSRGEGYARLLEFVRKAQTQA
jgi:hypothetical protein